MRKHELRAELRAVESELAMFERVAYETALHLVEKSWREAEQESEIARLKNAMADMWTMAEHDSVVADLEQENLALIDRVSKLEQWVDQLLERHDALRWEVLSALDTQEEMGYISAESTALRARLRTETRS